MKTPLINPATTEKDWYLIDAKDKILGRMATIIANKLRGKDKVIFSPHLDCGDFVIVINAEKVRLTGDKLQSKLYRRHSGYPSGLHEETAEKMLKRNPRRVIELAVSGMLPKNRTRKHLLEKLKIYAGESHPHIAQQPKNLEI